MQEPYAVLGQALSLACGVGFDSAQIRARLEDGFTEIEYVCADHGQERFVLPPSGQGSRAHDALHALRNEMTIPGQQPWSRCTFTLFPDGKFKFDVEYDD